MKLSKQANLGRTHAPQQMMRADLVWLRGTCGGDHLEEGMPRISMEVEDSIGLVWNHECPLAQRVLCRHAYQAAIGVAGQRLDQADGKHEASASIDPVGSNCVSGGYVERAHDLACSTDFDPVPYAYTDQGVVHEGKPPLASAHPNNQLSEAIIGRVGQEMA